MARRDERGLSQSVQYAVITPTLMLVTLGSIQAGVWVHGHNVAVRAAQTGADVARGSYGGAGEAQDRAGTLAAAGGLRDVEVRVSRGPERVDVTVSARAPLILDVGLGRIAETASAPRERVTPP
ncbi:MAG TPA: TadE/TadG family type IV pilus assembly protein [Propionibacteriaceae bacterium]|nr:TadE/TadG family type IV pilus assembly protein [Propionibacteriaceae bacterium]